MSSLALEWCVGSFHFRCLHQFVHRFAYCPRRGLGQLIRQFHIEHTLVDFLSISAVKIRILFLRRPHRLQHLSEQRLTDELMQHFTKLLFVVIDHRFRFRFFDLIEPRCRSTVGTLIFVHFGTLFQYRRYFRRHCVRCRLRGVGYRIGGNGV